MNLRSTLLAVALTSVTTGCSSSVQTVEASSEISCPTVDTRAVAPDEQTPLGTPNEVITGIARAQEAQLRWFSHPAGTQTTGDTQLTIQVVPDVTSATYRTRTAKDAANGSYCGDLMEMSGVLRFQTRDGAFDEEFPGTLLKRIGNNVNFEGKLSAVEFQGNYDRSWLPPSHAGAPYLLRTALSPALSGNIFVQSEQTSSNPNGVYTSALIAEWPASP